jgi:capsular polysaccharide biosynthesis protein
VFAVFGMAVVVMTPPAYQANTKMFINAGSNSQHIGTDQLASSIKLVETCEALIRSYDVLQPIIDTLGLTDTYDSLAGKIKVEPVNETPVMTITVKYSDPGLAQSIVKKITEVAPPIIEDKMEGGHLKAVESAIGPAKEVNPSIPGTMIKYAAVGFVLSAAFFVGLFFMDNTFHTERDLRRALDLPVLGVIPAVESCRKAEKSIKKGIGV